MAEKLERDVHSLVERLAKRHGREGMRAIATLMHDLGSDATIYFSDGKWLTCDFLMQHAWELGGQPEPEQT